MPSVAGWCRGPRGAFQACLLVFGSHSGWQSEPSVLTTTHERHRIRKDHSINYLALHTICAYNKFSTLISIRACGGDPAAAALIPLLDMSLVQSVYRPPIELDSLYITPHNLHRSHSGSALIQACRLLQPWLRSTTVQSTASRCFA